MASPILFNSYMEWMRVLLNGLQIPIEDLVTHLTCVIDIVQRELPKEIRSIPLSFIESGITTLEEAPDNIPTHIGEDAELSVLATQYLNTLLRNEFEIASQLLVNALEQGTDIRSLFLHVIAVTQREVGRLWLTNKITVAQEHYCTSATQQIMARLYQYRPAIEKKGFTVVIACVSGELHEVGARILAEFFEMDGWDVIFLGANTPVKGILKILEERTPDLLAISATMTYHLSIVKELIDEVRNNAKTKSTRIMVGGRPFNLDNDLWKTVGADGYAFDAEKATVAALNLVAGDEGSEMKVEETKT
jgi:methanogenic corrinoid protein MtbC1